MAVWTDVAAHLSAHHLVELRRDDWLALAFRDPEQLVHVHRFARSASVRILLLAEVCPWAWTTPGEALTRNLFLASGSLVVLGDALALRQILPLGSLDLADLDDNLRSLCADADRLRHRWTPRPVATSEVFVTYVD